jgi:hypothetical protein
MYSALYEALTMEIERMGQLQYILGLYEVELDICNKELARYVDTPICEDSAVLEAKEMSALDAALMRYVGIDFSSVMEGHADQFPSVANLRQDVRQKAQYRDSENKSLVNSNEGNLEDIDENNIFRQLGVVQDAVVDGGPPRETGVNIYTVNERNASGFRFGSRLRWASELSEIRNEEVEEILLDLLFGQLST